MFKRLIFLIVLIALSTSVCAQRFNKKSTDRAARDSRWEASLLVAYQNSTGMGSEGGSSLDIDSKAGWGLTVGWNWTSKWNLAYKLTVVNPDYSAFLVPDEPEVPQTIDYNMSRISHQFNVTYNFWDKAFTPFVQAGIGMTTLDSNIPSEPPRTGCWWDPWWGYICATEWKTFKTTEFSYNLGLGMRWDINNAMFTRASYNREFVGVKKGSLDFDLLTVEFGLVF